MIQADPMPGEPWPHDMVITVEDELRPLLELLWIREAWQLDHKGDDLPPPLVDTPTVLSADRRSAAPIREWRNAWPGVWAATLQHAGTPRDPGVFARLQASEDRSEERARLLRELVGPSWQEEMGAEAITEETQQWMHARFLRHGSRPPVGREEQPEYVALEALIEAWRGGVTTIVELPCRGAFTRRIGPHAILVTAETRADPARYRAALGEFC